MKKPFVFISYASKEADSANLVYSYLEGNGVNCWIASRNIEGGESFAAQIVDAIHDCSAFVMIASDVSNNSAHVSNELSLAFGERKKIIPFRLQNFTPSKNNLYFLQQAQWIDAFEDINAALKSLLSAVRTAIPEQAKKVVVTKREIPVNSEPTEKAADIPDYSRNEIVDILLKKIDKYPYCLKSRTRGDDYLSFKQKAKTLFEHTLSMHFRGRFTSGGLDYVDIIVDTLSQGSGISIQVKGLPGCAKNMLLQLAYYKMLENFRNGTSDYLPLYLSSSYYEKFRYNSSDPREAMTSLIKKDSLEFLNYINKNPHVQPVLMVEAVREHVVSKFAPEDVITDLWQGFGKYNRIIAVDVGLIKNRQRLKRSIPLMGDSSGYSFSFHSVPVSDKEACLSVIRTILDMYSEQYDGMEENDVYNALYRLRFSTLDIFTVRLVATELAHGRSVEDISLTDMYERLALNELSGDEEKMISVAHELYEYMFNELHNVKTNDYNAVLWSLPHKHSTYMEFMIAYFFCHKILMCRENKDYSFLQITMTSMANHFLSARLCDNYLLQETLLRAIIENYESFNMRKKSNSAYWLGKISYADLRGDAVKLLEKEFERLKPLVKTNNSATLENKYNHHLFRSVCLGLISHGRANILDEYLCLVVTNDIANAINRGNVIEYLGDNCQTSVHNDFYMDDDPNIGEQAIKILCSKVDFKLSQKRSGFVETDLVSLLCLVQAKMHCVPENLSYNLTPFCEKCLELLVNYRKRPRNIISEKLIYYFSSVEDDLSAYIEKPRFDAAYRLFTDLTGMKDTKRTQWQNFGIDDPESVAEHTISAWFMAMVFLPQESSEQGYNKREIMDMLIVHDMAEAILGDCSVSLSEPTKELKQQNNLLKKMFLKGTYPEVANMTHYYNVWTGYYNGQNINARIARDINLIQTVNTFFTYCGNHPEKFTKDDVLHWLNESNKLSTDMGYDLFERIISHNHIHRKIIDEKITGQAKFL
ncbi:MAG: TIR domain-containing protein [Clostridia bacterium]|nr:TIR domain-containing protein [Clostridia bacterium]